MGRTIDLLEVRKMKKDNGWSAEMMTALGGLYDFEVNLMNFNIPDETEQRMLFDFTQLAVQQSQYNDAILRLVAEGESRVYSMVKVHFAHKPDAKITSLENFYRILRVTSVTAHNNIETMKNRMTILVSKMPRFW